MTYNTKGPTTVSHSTTSGGVTYTNTSKGGKYYATRTQRFADGSVERKRTTSSYAKKKGSASKEVSGLGVIVLGIIILIGLIFGG